MAKYSPAEEASSQLIKSIKKFLVSAEDRKSEINTRIDSLIQRANVRRQQMLTEIDNEVQRVEEEVEKKQQQLDPLKIVESGIDANLSSNQPRESMLEALSGEVGKIDLKLSQFRLKWSSTFTRIIGEIDPLCELIIYTQSPFELEDSNTPLWSARLTLGKANAEVIEAKSVAIDRETGNIYVGDASGRKILIFNKVGDFNRTLALSVYPSAIGRMVIHDNSIFCHNNSFLPATVVYKLNKNTGVQEATFNARSSIKGIAIWDNSVYTSAYDLSHLNVLTLYLIEVNQSPISSPYFKKAKVLGSFLQDIVAVDGEIVLLISNCEYPIHVFDLSARLLRFVKLDKYSALLDACLCIDQHWNIMVTTILNKLIHVYSKEGREIASVGRQGQDKDEMHYPRGIVLDADNNLIVCSCKKQYLLQAY